MKYFVLFVGIPFFLLGCKGGVDKTLTQVVEESYPLDESGTLRVKSEDGTIRLYGGDTQQLRVKIIKRAFSAERLRGLSVRVTSHNDAAAIEASSPPRKKWSLADRSGTVDFTIIMPQHLTDIALQLTNGEISIDGLRAGKARASLGNGRISARNCFADLDYETQNGAVDFYYDWWEPGTYLVKAAIANGSVALFLPRAASFRLVAQTNGGSIMGNVVNGDDEPHRHRKKLDKNIGGGEGPTFQLKSGNSNVRIHGY